MGRVAKDAKGYSAHLAHVMGHALYIYIIYIHHSKGLDIICSQLHFPAAIASKSINLMRKLPSSRSFDRPGKMPCHSCDGKNISKGFTGEPRKRPKPYFPLNPGVFFKVSL